MKPVSFGPIRNWFGYTRRERRASFILLIIIVAVAFVRFVVPDKKMPIREVALSIPVNTDDLSSAGIENPGEVNNYTSVKFQPKRMKLDLNTCDSAALEALPGIGPVLSARIIRYRNLLGGFALVSQLREVYGLPEETFDLIYDRLMADSSAIRKININTADFRQLIRLPYFDRYEVTAILKYRELKGKISTIEELVENNLITDERLKRIRPYLEI